MVYHLKSEDYIDSKSACGCSYFRGPENICYLHDHEFFEFVITLDGNTIHEIGGVRTKLQKNTLMLIRPHDMHRYVDEGQGIFSYINFLFAKDTFFDVGRYLGEEKIINKLVAVEKPPQVVLSDDEAKEIVNRFLSLMGNTMVKNPTVVSRGIVASVLSRYFLSGNGENEDIPEWFTSLCIDMHRIDFFSDKLTKGCMKTDKSYGYICHCFKKYLNTTPTDYINRIRLNYAGNLLLNSNMSVLDVSLECGFENLGHFYKLFKAKNGISPGKYKKLMQSKLII